MLKFDKTHEKVNGNLDKYKGKKVKYSVKIAGLALTSLLTFTGCGKEIDCDIETDHYHYYVQELTEYGRYLDSEKKMLFSISSPERDIIKKTDDYVTKTPESSELLDFLYESNLYRIDLNEEVINAQIERHQDHIEGEVLGLKQKYMSGSYMIVPTSTWETKRENRSYASERLCHYCYYAYKVEMDENGKYITVRSEPVDDLSELPEGYDYVTRDFIQEKYSYDREVIEEFEQSTSMSRSI